MIFPSISIFVWIVELFSPTSEATELMVSVLFLLSVSMTIEPPDSRAKRPESLVTRRNSLALSVMFMSVVFGMS